MDYFINILLVLTIPVSRCQDKTDLEIVMVCPSTKEEWDRAAQKKNCSKFVALNAHEEQYEYHCLINAYLNETVEVCAQKKWISGYCTEFNVAAGVIKNHLEAKCNETYPRCDKAYSSADAYKYLDCYQIVYDKRKKDFTTYLQTTLVHSKDKEDNGNTESIAAAIFGIVIVVLIGILVFIKKHTRKKKKELDEEESFHLTDIKAVDAVDEEHTRKKKKELDEEESFHLTDIKAVDAVDEGEGSIRYFHFKMKRFQHFSYVYTSTKKIIQNNAWLNEKQLKDTIIKIGVVGKCNKENLHLFSKGQTDLNGEKQNVWEAVPVVCFQNDLSVQSAIETLRQNKTSYRILVSSKSIPHRGDNSIIIIGPTENEIIHTITVCLEQPLRHMLQQLLKDLPTKDSSRLASKRSGVIEALIKEMTFDKNKETIKEQIPEELRDYLSRSDGFEQARLGPSSLDILVDKKTDKKLMEDDMAKLNKSFLKRFPLTIQRGTMIKQNTGGFVKATDNDKKKSTSTRGHVVPEGNKSMDTKVRYALKKYRSDTEQEKERPTDVKDSHRQKTEKNTMRDKISAASSVEDVNDELEKPPEAETTSRQRLEPLPSVSNNKKAIQEEERLLSNIANRGEQSMAFQTKVLQMLAPQKTTERTAYADWTKEVMVNLHPSLWLKFQRECTNLLYTYQEKSEELLHPVASEQVFPVPQLQYSAQQQQCQAFPGTSSGTSTSAMWQPPPQQWPTTVEQNTSVWGSQNPVWVQAQMTNLQPTAMMTCGHTPSPLSNRATTSTPTQSAEQSSNLSSLVNSSMEMCNTSLDRAVVDECKEREKQ